MFELTVLGINVLLPALVTLAGGVLAWKLQRRPNLQPLPEQPADREAPPTTQRGNTFLQGIVISGAAAAAVWIAFALRTQWAAWHEDAWMRLPVAVALVALSAAVTAGLTKPGWVWTVRVLAVAIASATIFPTGEAWEFLLPTRYQWLALITLSTCVGWILCHALAPQLAAILSLNWIVLLVAAAYLTSQSFLKVTEPLMAVASVLGCLSLLSLRSGAPRMVSWAAGPCLFATSAAIASAQFNSFLGLPDALSWYAMLTPALLALATYRFAGSAGHGGSGKYALICVVVALVLAATLIGWTNGMLPEGGEEW
jgi:hypothetical protein